MSLGKVNVAIQILPFSLEQPKAYSIVDKCIEEIQKSGLEYKVCPFETVIEGNYNEVMALVERVQLVAYQSGAINMLTNVKIQSSNSGDVTINDKMEKYQ
jgi:uncharacterized protein YqgV (UPF0045/DUF77 family)